MELPDIFNVTITRETQFPTGPAFGVPMLVASHSYWPERAKRFTQVQELLDAGVDEEHPLIAMATALVSQENKRPDSFIVGKRLLPSTQIVTLTIKDATEGDVYRFSITTPDGVDHAITYTIPAAATTTTVAAAIAALIDALSDVVATSAVAVITATTTVGKLVRYHELPPIAMLGVADTSTNPGIATDLTAIKAYTDLDSSLSWFGLLIDHSCEAIINAAATWIEAQKLVYLYRTSDSLCADSGTTTDVASDLKAASYTQTGGIFAQYDTHDYRDCALMGQMLPQQPGSATWAHKTLTGIHVDKLTSGEAATLEGKNLTTYREIGGLGDTIEGKVALGEFFDIIHGQLYLESQIQFRGYGVIKAVPKLPYTDEGIQAVVAAVSQVLQENEDSGYLAADPKFVVTAPKASAISSVQKSTRQLTGVKFRANLAGAIHRVVITGTLAL